MLYLFCYNKWFVYKRMILKFLLQYNIGCTLINLQLTKYVSLIIIDQLLTLHIC